MAYQQPLTDIETLTVGEKRLYRFDNHKPVLVYRLTDGFYATDARCTHLFKSMAKGTIENDKTIRCPLHRAEFDIRTGQVTQWACFPPGIVQAINTVRHEKPLSCYPISEKNGEYFITLH